MTSQVAGKSTPDRKSRRPDCGELDDRARQVADVGLVEGVAPDDLEAVAASVDADRKHTRGADHLARRVDGQIAHGLAARLLRDPAPGRGELEVLADLRRPVDDLAPLHAFYQTGGRRSRNAVSPSTGSRWDIRSSRY